MHEKKNVPNEAHTSHGTTTLACHKTALVILSSTQRDLQEHSRRQTPTYEDGTYNVGIAYPMW
jgi:hypothetical protein